MFEITPYPAFSWSFSRHKTLANCARKYGYDYYFSHNGEPFHQHVYRLKKLQSMPILFGQIVHNIIRTIDCSLFKNWRSTDSSRVGE